MRRREFIALAGSAAVALPRAAGAQEGTGLPVVGYLYAGSPELSASYLAGFRKGLSETGHIEGRNIAIEYRFARNDIERLEEMAADLVRRQVAVIAAPGLQAAVAAKKATSTIPVIFQVAGDPVQLGLSASLNRPEGNLTGVSSLSTEIMGKRLQLLHELVPKAIRFAALLVGNSPNREFNTDELNSAASALGLQMEIFAATTDREIDLAFMSLAQTQSDVLLVGPGPLFTNRRVQIVTLAAHHHLPALYGDRAYVEAGGLASYGSSVADQFRLVGIYTGRVLKGEKPAEIPIMRASKFELVINLQMARTQGIEIPPTLLAQADEVIE